MQVSRSKVIEPSAAKYSGLVHFPGMLYKSVEESQDEGWLKVGGRDLSRRRHP